MATVSSVEVHDRRRVQLVLTPDEARRLIETGSLHLVLGDGLRAEIGDAVQEIRIDVA